MRVELLCFTRRGAALAARLAALLRDAGDEANWRRSGENDVKAGPWAARFFDTADALVFIGAAGIAVRAIAPLLKSKTTDPGVLVIDEAGEYVIPILSGHLGGANALALRAAALLDAQAVLTTATDVNGAFAADSWARELGLVVANPARIVEVSAKLLAGGGLVLATGYEIGGGTPEGLRLAGLGDVGADIVVDIAPERVAAEALWLVPPVVSVGVGCRKGTDVEAIEALFVRLLREHSLHPAAVESVCSIDIKKEEPGLVEFCQRHGLPLRTFTAAQLAAVKGDFSASAFVQKTVGVDNVCERSALLAGGGELLARKAKQDGVTMALAAREPELRWPSPAEKRE